MNRQEEMVLSTHTLTSPFTDYSFSQEKEVMSEWFPDLSTWGDNLMNNWLIMGVWKRRV
jgi:hypothetical protein